VILINKFFYLAGTNAIIENLGLILLLLAVTIASYFLAKSAPPLIEKAW
jgi:hypothetical protein